MRVFLKTGGHQPENTDAEAINKFFLGNYAKVWAMRDGYYPTFRNFEKGKIFFDLVTDMRFRDDDFLLSKFVAEQYALKVDILKAATSFHCRHFKTDGLVGCHVPEKSVLLPALSALIDVSLANLPSEPYYDHYGSIVKR